MTQRGAVQPHKKKRIMIMNKQKELLIKGTVIQKTKVPLCGNHKMSVK